MTKYLDTDDRDISLILFEGEDAPMPKKPSPSQLRRLRRAAIEANWLRLARLREAVASRRGERLRKRILALLLELDARGFTSHKGKHPVSVSKVKQGDLRAMEVSDFLEYLGPLVTEVDAKLTVVLDEQVEPNQASRFIDAVREIFGEAAASSMYVAHSKTKLEKLASDERLPKPSQRFYRDVGSETEQLHVRLINTDD